MRIKLALVLCFVSSSLLGQEIGKQYFLTGVDDSLRYCISVAEDLEKDVATFSVNENVATIFGVRGIEDIAIHSGKFLEVRFVVRGGSNVGVRVTVLLCVSKGEIHRALDILSDVTSRVTQVYDKVADSLQLFDEKEDYHVTISVKQKGNHYKAILSESKKVESKYDPSQNEAFEKTYELNFDLGGYFFYNSIKRLNKRYEVYSVKDNKTVEKYITAEVPCIELHQGYYALIDNQWCMNNGRDTLSCR
jgi:hypothetical protein